MDKFMALKFTFLSPFPEYHGQNDNGDQEWPPSPLRAFQALVDAVASLQNADATTRPMVDRLRVLSNCASPAIVGSPAICAKSFRLSVPNNDLDACAKLWVRGREPVKPHRPQDLRTMKKVSSVLLKPLPGDGANVWYLYKIGERNDFLDSDLRLFKTVARSVTHLGWGIDMVAADAEILDDVQVAALPGERWNPSPDSSGVALRVPTNGTLDALHERHTAFLNRLSADGFTPVPPLTAFKTVYYRRPTDPLKRPYACFQLLTPDGNQFRSPQEKLIHIHGMVRHLAIQTMARTRPDDTPDDWVETYVRGKVGKPDRPHRQFSYLPLPSIGHAHVDPSIRRVLIVAPVGDRQWLDFLSVRLLGQQLRPDPAYPSLSGPAPILAPPQPSPMLQNRYLGSSDVWASVTPVILPGHDDNNPVKTQKLLTKCLIQAGIEVPCTFEWRSQSWFPRSCSAHKTDRGGRPQGYFRPKHLLHQPAMHVRITFANQYRFNGPLAIGAGRHCGLGVFATHQ
jgi:CRISPR-associated protein Csb2